MKHETINIKNAASMEYAALHLYLQEDSPEIPIKARPMVIICPGGGYVMTSDREAEPIALLYLSMGYQAAVLRYSVEPARFPTALLELAKSVAVVREHAQEWHVDPEKLIVTGFSAGGHLAASFGCFWNRSFLAEAVGVESETLRPNAQILCYPVITSGEFAHDGSFHALLGEEYEAKKAEHSLENFVGPQVPRTFLWHTFEDGCVPVQNSLLMVNALTKAGIPTEFHLFEHGGHGISLANRLTAYADGSCIEPAAAEWTKLVRTWLEAWGG